MNNIDPLALLIPRYGFETEIFFTGEFCDANQFSGEEPVGHLHMVRKGPLFMEHEQSPTLMIEGPSLIFYPRPFRHRLKIPSGSSAELVCATIRFKEFNRNPIAQALPDYVQIRLDELDGLGEALILLFDEATRSDMGRRFILSRLCDIVVAHIIRFCQADGRVRKGIFVALSDPKIGHVIEAIQAHPEKSWLIEEMARLANMSRSKFAHYFHECTEKTPGEYLTDCRMALATDLLKEGKPVKQVALKVGYGSQPSFTRAFIAYFGMPPREWGSGHAKPVGESASGFHPR